MSLPQSIGQRREGGKENNFCFPGTVVHKIVATGVVGVLSHFAIISCFAGWTLVCGACPFSYYLITLLTSPVQGSTTNSDDGCH